MDTVEHKKKVYGQSAIPLLELLVMLKNIFLRFRGLFMDTDRNQASDLYNAFELNRERLQLTQDKTAKAAKIVINILEFWELKHSPVYSLFEEKLSKYEQSSDYEFSDEFVFATSLILGIYADLRKLFLQDMHHLEWMNSPHKHLEDDQPSKLIASGTPKHIEKVRNFIRFSL